MHWTVIQTNRWLPGTFDDYRPLSLYRQQRGLTTTLEIAHTGFDTKQRRATVQNLVEIDAAVWIIWPSQNPGRTTLPATLIIFIHHISGSIEYKHTYIQLRKKYNLTNKIHEKKNITNQIYTRFLGLANFLIN